ncbi:hypothetical protein VC83_04854 [Pseudogymnoascus destructans]|uniref:Transcription factor domain-containing protein n=1 Tax=Pseudogymnoascus destructans TaxID=655981 RepID=A0A177A629_9PEZI|nr:uncharacterized protein VC83_04854 [Pseudogymnoascus destructans]OAF57587.1 hypothetical protein VC83_04854 [Pseudogymnoascus destructans]
MPSPAYIAPVSGFVFGHADSGSSLIDYLPTRLAADRLVKQYYTAVHPVAQLLYYPSFEKEYENFWEDISLGIEPPTSVQAIVFAAGAVSMSEMVILRDFGVPKYRLINNFKSQRQRLASLTFYALRRSKPCRHLLCTLPNCAAQKHHAIRMAECMGLHRDGETYGLNPIETQVRRLIWYQLCGENLDRIWHCLDYVFETDPSEPRDMKAGKVLCELQEKTTVYQQFRKMRASPAMLKHDGQRPPRRVDRNINSGASSVSAQHGDAAGIEPTLIGKVPVPDVVFAGVSNGEALWALPSYGSPAGSSDSGGVPGQANPVQMLNTKMEYSMPEIDWDAIDILFPPNESGEMMQQELMEYTG